ncbi:MAG: uroporphyrinogen-III synthase [Bacteroidota bacterium]|nr:uroporphyrinogen-III synthase [Bacteroidota bacterium]MDP3144576.1 uroporphyrinogen-III synthase [Bacteroidota bacterium]
MKLTGKKIFISRKLLPDSPFNILLKDQNYEVIDQSLIQITQIRFSYTPQTNWIFFTSKNSIDCFFAQNPDIPKQVKYGVISNASAKHLLKYTVTADFIGAGVDLIKIAKDFREILQNESVLFPQAIDSYQTIQKQLAFTNTCYNLYVYKTSIRTDIEIPYSDILIFTSPSNVIAYYNKYKVDPRQSVIAIGSTTKYKLNEYKVSNVLTPDSFDERGLVKVLVENQIF